ncbi:AsmA family protein [Xanthobacter sp. DSM 24535]|uniref:AsmA family protein n=1 Tax=Roseixanthobacter psychrophilus TaxID=3119917 RepID=UPI0037272576
MIEASGSVRHEPSPKPERPDDYVVNFGATARRVMLILAATACVLAAACVAAMVLVPALLPSTEVRRLASDALLRATGRVAHIAEGDVSSGEPGVALLPSPRLILGKFTVSLDDGATFDAEGAVARLRILPLLLGRMEVADITLLRPTLLVTGKRIPSSFSLSPLVGGDDVPELRLRGGTIAMRSREGLTQELISDIDVSLERSSGGNALAATLAFTWRDRQVDGRIAIADAAAFLAGRGSESRLDLSTDSSWVRFRGLAAGGSSPTLLGDASGETSALRGLLDWVEFPAPTSGGFGHFSFSGKVSANRNEISLTPANAELDGNRSDGALSIKLDGPRPSIQGTFAADALNITPYGRLILTDDSGSNWDHGALSTEGLKAVDVDLRLSAGTVRTEDRTFERVATSATLRAGRLVLALGNVQAWGGSVRASLALAPRPDAASGVLVHLEGDAKDVALDQALDDLAGLRKLEGKGDLQLLLEGSGNSIFEVAQSLQGQVALSGKAGAVVGLDVAQVLKRIEQRPLSAGGGEMRGGRTAYDSLAAKFSISKGMAFVDEGRLEAKQVRVNVGGTVSVVLRELDLHGKAALMLPSGGDQLAFDLPFLVQGAWNRPDVMIDPQSLIRRSGAAQPLLDAVRARGSGEAAVRSVIEQLAKPSPVRAPGN